MLHIRRTSELALVDGNTFQAHSIAKNTPNPKGKDLFDNIKGMR
jgi:hypothetical protein